MIQCAVYQVIDFTNASVTMLLESMCPFKLKPGDIVNFMEKDCEVAKAVWEFDGQRMYVELSEQSVDYPLTEEFAEQWLSGERDDGEGYGSAGIFIREGTKQFVESIAAIAGWEPHMVWAGDGEISSLP